MNNLPMIIAACDKKYFMEYALSFQKSCASKTQFSQIFITLDYEEDKDKQLSELNTFFVEKYNKAFTSDERQFIINPELINKPDNIKIIDKKAYYASLRFLILPLFLSKYKKPTLVLDIDSVINNAIGIPEEFDIGLYLRENNNVGANDYEIMGMKVAAGILYINGYSQEAINFSLNISNEIVQNEIKWFCDQHAIYKTYLKYKDKLKIKDFNGTGILDWEFEKGTQIWTAKGNRKTNPLFLERKKEYEQTEGN